MWACHNSFVGGTYSHAAGWVPIATLVDSFIFMKIQKRKNTQSGSWVTIKMPELWTCTTLNWGSNSNDNKGISSDCYES